MSDHTAVDTMGREETGYQLIASDPKRVGPIRLLRRMRASTDPLETGEKPFPFLGVAEHPGTPASWLIVKVVRLPASPLALHCLEEEEDWAQDTGRLHSSADNMLYRWVARRYIAGTPLNRLPSSVTPEQRAVYARWLLKEINDWHVRHGESHLDVKPSNVIVTDERAVLIDFETSRDHGAQHPFSGLATASFASPEQVVYRPGRNAGTASDLFSWGVTVYHLFRPGAHPYCSGPFDQQQFARIDDAVAAGSRAPAPDLTPLPAWLRPVVARALAWDPEARSSAAALLEDLDRTQPMFLVQRLAATPDQPPMVSAPLPRAWLHSARWWFGPEGPLGERHLDPAVLLIGLVASATSGLLVGLLLSVIVGKVF